MLVEMDVAGMIIEDDEKSYYMLLKEKKGDTVVSIAINQVQAESITISMDPALSRIHDPYDLIGNMIESFELKISKVVINNRERHTKNSGLYFTDGEREIRVDSFAGDAVAVAARMNVPIFIDSDFLGRTHIKEVKKWLSTVKPSDFGDAL